MIDKNGKLLSEYYNSNDLKALGCTTEVADAIQSIQNKQIYANKQYARMKQGKISTNQRDPKTYSQLLTNNNIPLAFKSIRYSTPYAQAEIAMYLFNTNSHFASQTKLNQDI